MDAGCASAARTAAPNAMTIPIPTAAATAVVRCAFKMSSPREKTGERAKNAVSKRFARVSSDGVNRAFYEPLTVIARWRR
jgi:hypothetical protein